jgi:hypothetical protein
MHAPEQQRHAAHEVEKYQIAGRRTALGLWMTRRC